MAGPHLALKIGFAALPGTPEKHVSVDGMTRRGPNLSHWPGNRTPAAFKADLSTGICLAFARASTAEQRAFLDGAETIVNDHYDTDGFLSMLALARPEVALARAEVCLTAAATGDYQSFHDQHGFAVDRIVLNLPRSPDSPIADRLTGKTDAERALCCYQWLIDNAERVLDDPWSLAPLFEAELASVLEQLARTRIDAVRDLHADCGLAVVRTPAPIHRIVLNTVAGAFRVLHCIESERGLLVRYHDRTESWFELATFEPPARRDLRPLAAQLRDLDADGNGRWCADPPDQPVPELYHGIPEPQEYGQITRTLTATAVSADAIERAVAGFFRELPWTGLDHRD